MLLNSCTKHRQARLAAAGPALMQVQQDLRALLYGSENGLAALAGNSGMRGQPEASRYLLHSQAGHPHQLLAGPKASHAMRDRRSSHAARPHLLWR